MDKAKFTKNMTGDRYQVDDLFFSRLMDTARTKVIPYQWEALNDRIPDAEKSHAVANFKIAAGLEKGEFAGCVFQDSDLAKWIEAAAYSLMWHKDEKLEKELDDIIDVIEKAQMPDGYLDTYYIIGGPEKRWTNLKDNHELYCAGHFLEAAVAYYQATGKRKLLDVLLRLVDHIDARFGPEEGKLKGYPGHEVIEMALVKLYEITGEEKHLKLAQYFIDQRGQSPLYFKEETERNGNGFYWKNSYFQYQYYQAGKPVREQTEAVGHAVRAGYLYSGMAAVARAAQDESLLEACHRMWDSIVNRRMYITGQIGSADYGEAFTFDYDLPNDTAYAETCAGLSLVFFAQRMLQIEQKGEYADVMERALYNGTISGMSLDGTRFFYVNPLEVLPEACEKDQIHRHVKVERQKWFGCACCPPNLARTMTSIASYAAASREDAYFQHLYLSGTAKVKLNGVEAEIQLTSGYPWKGDIQVEIRPEKPVAFTYAIRIPGWCQHYELKVCGAPFAGEVKDGYAYITREWQPGDRVELTLDMPVETVYANTAVREDIGKVAVQRGPIVFCLEECDNGRDLHKVYLPEQPEFEAKFEEGLLEGVVTVACGGYRLEGEESGALYTTRKPAKFVSAQLKFIPYYAWTNRTPGEMMVWIRQR